ncbi:hypothetical protein NDU88_003372 [Pleurodeles waltl]|uniref:Uncharacterized protein n=1 Tax=Pleurodeles waltl TaxID=8319 RepID=A0AAV7W275_PLEWA|nr:hypothetical protein NDU88_003372 [Pleurodeles waltl]
MSRQWIRRCSGPDAGPTASVGGYALAALRPRGRRVARPGAPGASPAGRRSSCVSFAAWVNSRGNPPFEASRAPRRSSARASAQLSPSQPAAGPRHAAHLSRESGGPRRGGCSCCGSFAVRVGPRGPLLKAARAPRLLQLVPPGVRAAQPGAPGAPLAGRGSATPPVHRGSRSKAQRRLLFSLHGAPGPRQSHQGGGNSASVSSRQSGSDCHFRTRASARERGSASLPLTSSGPRRDGEIAGMAGAALLGR